MTNISHCARDQNKEPCVEELIFPKTPFNRPGLPRIDYRTGTYRDIREYLLRKLNLDPVLVFWTHREPGDPGIALLESAAIAGDILTFYQDLYANEAYIRTAQWRESIADLVRLTGYRLSPGIGGKATFSIEVKDDKNKTGKSVTIPMGFPIKAQVDGLETPADFETSTALTAYPALSKFNLYRPTLLPPFPQKTSVFSADTTQLQAAGIVIAKGDRLILLDSVTNPTGSAEIVSVNEVEESFGRTEITIDGTWSKGYLSSSIKCFKLGRTFRHFGHNAPPEAVIIDSKGAANLSAVSFSRKLHGTTVTSGVTTINPSLAAPSLPLDGEVKDLAVGAKLVIQGLRSKTIVRETKAVAIETMTWGTLVGTGTNVTLTREMDDRATWSSSDYRTADIRKLSIHETEGSSFFILRNTRQNNGYADGSRLHYYGTADDYSLLNNRKLLFEKNDGSVREVSVTKPPGYSAPATGSAFHPLVLDAVLGDGFSLADFPLESPGVTVYGNLTDATQGKTEKEEVLGNGDQRQEFQSFKLPKATLTYHNRSGESPPEVPELQVYVNDRQWTRVDVFFGRSPKEEIYIVREDEKNNSWVQFGDGKTGARLPSGIRNVTAVYRTGTGAYGALKDGTNPQAGGKAERLGKVFMPGSSSGGDGPEEGDIAREAAPGKTQALGRLVSLKDYESEALAIPGVSRATAAWEVSDQQAAVTLTLLMETGQGDEFETIKEILNGYNRCLGPQRFPVETSQGQRKYIFIHAEYGLDAAYKETIVEDEIKKALGVNGEEANGIDGRDGLFGARQRRFGQHAYASRIEAVVNNVDGVLWVNVKLLWPMGTADDPADLPSGFTVPPIDFTPITSKLHCGPNQVLCLYKNHLQLSTAKGETAGRC